MSDATPRPPDDGRTIVDAPDASSHPQRPRPTAPPPNDGRTIVDAPGAPAAYASSGGLLDTSAARTALPSAAAPAGGGYVVRRLLARGGVGELHLAQKPGVRQWFVVKRLLPDYRRHPHFLERFDEECDIADLLAHDNIVRFRDRGEDGDGPFAVFNYVEGPYPVEPGMPWVLETLNPPLSLQEWVDRHGPRPAAEMVPFFRQLCGALGLMNRKQVVHRDLKPANVLVRAGDDGPEPVLADFGLARSLTTAGKDPITPVGAMIGTPGYMAPEQQSDPRTVDFRADLYSLGATLVFALMGRPPTDDAPALDGIDLELRELCLALLARDRERRVQHVEDVDRRLAAIEMRFGPAGRHAAAKAADQDLPACAVCAAVQESDKAEYCRKCGSELFWDCPRCRHRQAVWDRFCAACRCDGFVIRDAVRTEAVALQTELPPLVASNRLAEALRRVGRIRRFRHPVTATQRQWADREAAMLRQRGRALRARRQEIARDAERLAAAHQYRNAYVKLAEVPADLLTHALRDRQADAAAKAADVQRLHKRLTEARKSATPWDALADLDAYVALVPSDAAGPALRTEWQQAYERTARRQFDRVKQRPTAEAYLEFIKQFPNSSSVPEARQAVAGLLREVLLTGPTVAARQAYLDCRTEELARLDERHARMGNVIGVGGLGLLAGAIAGFVLGGFFSVWVWIALGVLGGAIAAGGAQAAGDGPLTQSGAKGADDGP